MFLFGCGKNNTKSDDEDSSKKFKDSIKLLLLGTGESGKTTIIKQMRILHIDGFSDEEKKGKIPFILKNIKESIYDIAYNMDKISPPVKLSDESNQSCLEYVLDLPTIVEVYDDTFFTNVKRLWNDAGMQETFTRSNEYQLIDSAQHFLDRIDEVRQANYVPSTQDILFCRIRTTGISEIEFKVPLPKLYGGGSARFLMYDVGGQRGERKKWIQVFEGVQAILFIIATSDYDQTLREDQRKNRLEEAFAVFTEVSYTKFLRSSGMIVFLNKQDILKKKLGLGRSIVKYIPDFAKYQSSLTDEYERANAYMTNRLTTIANMEVTDKVYDNLSRTVSEVVLPPRSIYIHRTIATDTKNIKIVFESVNDMIIRSMLEKVAAL